MRKEIHGRKEKAQLNVKLNPEADRGLTVKTLAGVPGVKGVTQTFPGETDAELSGLHIFEVDASKLKSVLQRIRKNPGVEYAEPVASRRLM
jgi:hypothetical protein